MLTPELLAKVKRIEIRAKRAVNELTAGAWLSTFKGKGVEFDDVREYFPGDDVRSIDWKVTARMRKPFIKQFTEERELSLFLLVDVSASGDIGSFEKSKNELAAEIAALLSMSAINNGDRVGLMLFSDHEELFLKAQKGQRHIKRIIRELLAFNRKNKKTNLSEAIASFIRYQKRRSIVVLISDFIDEEYTKALGQLNRKHELICMRLYDPLELKIPELGQLCLEDAETGELQTLSSEEINKLNLENDVKFRETATNIRKSGASLIDLAVNEDCFGRINQFFSK